MISDIKDEQVLIKMVKEYEFVELFESISLYKFHSD